MSASGDLNGKLCVITGANSGIGLGACINLASRGCEVVMCCRNMKKAAEAQAEVLKKSGADANKVHIAQLDLSDLDNVETFRSRYDALPGIATRPIDILILNAGVMAIPHREVTKQGLEMQMATNDVGHFKFAGAMFDLCKAAPTCRIVVVASLMHRFASTINFDDFNREKHYSPMNSYAESKLGNLLFVAKLNRLLVEKKLDRVVAVGCHPGYSDTGLQKGFNRILNFLAQSPEMGAAPTIKAATDIEVKRDDYCGPSHFFEVRGAAKWGCYKTKVVSDVALQDKFWDKLEEVTKVDFAGKI